MKAAVLYRLNAPLRILDDIPIPALNRGQVLVRIAYSGVCRSQLMEVRGGRGEDPYLPHMLGHEGAGTVMETGDGVTKVAPEDRVVLGWIKGEGIDAPGAKYRYGNEVINAGGVTTFSDHAVVSENRCVSIPDYVPLDVAVLFGCAVPTGAGIVMNRIRPEKGSTMAIFGLGGIGISALMATMIYECSAVIAVDVDEGKIALARELGATHGVNAARKDPVAEILGITGNRGVDYSVESAGLSRTIEDAFRSVRKFGGLCVFASHPRTGEKIGLDPHDLISGRRIEGSWGGSSRPDTDIPLFAGLYRDGRLPLEKLISDRYPLEEINRAIDDLESGKIVRVLIEMNSGKR
ncbi:MAG: zinc-binding dehydrogenase [Deltaproteobacteria bacterium]|nr:zinc-binding dehydrogenase [Deltaproteobacteria bacterium]